MRLPLILYGLLTIAFASPLKAQNADVRDCFVVGDKTWDNPKLFDRRITACTRLIDRTKGKHKAEAYNSRGYWFSKKQAYDEALIDFDLALEIDPTNVEIYDYKADALLGKGDVKAAIESYDQSIRVDPTYAAAYVGRGEAYERLGDLKMARESYKAALVPPLRRALLIQERTQAWAQNKARSRLKQLEQVQRD